MAVVKFNEVEAFINELAADANKVDRGIVRIVFRRSTDSYPFQVLSLIASAVVAGHVVRLERRIGSYVGESDGKRVGEECEMVADKIRSAIAGMSLEVRSGSFEAA